MSRKDLGLRAIFGAPIILFTLSLTGLVTALLGDGPWDGIGAVCLGATIVATVWALVRRRR